VFIGGFGIHVSRNGRVFVYKYGGSNHLYVGCGRVFEFVGYVWFEFWKELGTVDSTCDSA
jgi:hypothetical protein